MRKWVRVSEMEVLVKPGRWENLKAGLICDLWRQAKWPHRKGVRLVHNNNLTGSESNDDSAEGVVACPRCGSGMHKETRCGERLWRCDSYGCRYPVSRDNAEISGVPNASHGYRNSEQREG
jgi:hypothetical protein